MFLLHVKAIPFCITGTTLTFILYKRMGASNHTKPSRKDKTKNKKKD